MEKYNKLKEVMVDKGYTVTVVEDYAALSCENGKHLINFYTIDDIVLTHLRPNGKTTLERVQESQSISEWFRGLINENVQA